MDLSFLNFKSVLVVLTSDGMKEKIFSLIDEQEVEVRFKFTHSYIKAAQAMQERPADPYDHVILNLSYSNKKLFDFVEYIKPNTVQNPAYLLEYTNDGELLPVSLGE